MGHHVQSDFLSNVVPFGRLVNSRSSSAFRVLFSYLCAWLSTSP